ncbi:Degenerin-like protein asic-1 [Aphelenchoides bicaudatus]|nr:Degenerin-like protein asic-1 [Aphelenchoides bicaudatus]
MSSQIVNRLATSVRDFAEHTSAHGVPRAFNSNGLRRVLWLLLFFTCLTAFIAQAIQIVKRFSRNDIIVGVELKFENISFSNIELSNEMFVCNLNPYKNSLARSLGSVKDTLMAFDDAMERSDQSKSQRSKRSVDPSFQQKTKELYEKMHSGYEGLLAAYSFCDCPPDKPDCTALKKVTNGSSLCVCFYNSKNDAIWPCYTPQFWSERRCKSCGALGNCEFTDDEKEGKLPCLCVPKIRLCVRIEEKAPEQSQKLAWIIG